MGNWEQLADLTEDTRNMEANVSDELIEAMARELAKADHIEICSDASYALSAYGIRARALLPVIRAHLEPTSEMVEEGIKSLDAYFDEIDECSREYTQDAVIETFEDMLAASPIGDVVCTLWKK